MSPSVADDSMIAVGRVHVPVLSASERRDLPLLTDYCVDSEWSQGLTISTPVGAKSGTFRVTTAIP